MELNGQTIETPEQKAERMRNEQVSEFRDAMRMALNSVNMELREAGHQPGTGEVVAAAMMIAAEFIAMSGDRNARRKQIVAAVNSLPKLVAQHTAAKGGIDMKNKLSDLNDHLFMQLERLGDEGLTPEQIETEAKRGEAIVSVAEQIIRNADLTFKAVTLVANHGDRFRPALNNLIAPPSPNGGGSDT